MTFKLLQIPKKLLFLLFMVNMACLIGYLFINPLTLLPNTDSLFFATGSRDELLIKMFSLFIGSMTVICLIFNLILAIGFLTDKFKVENIACQHIVYSISLAFFSYLVLNVGIWLINSTYWIQLAFNVSNDRLTNISFIAFPYILLLGLILLLEDLALKTKIKQCLIACITTFLVIFNFNSLALPTVAKNFHWQNYFAVLNEPIYIVNHNGLYYSYTTHIKTMTDFTRGYSDFSRLYTTIMINKLTESESIQLVERYYMRFPSRRDSFLERYSGSLFSYTSLSKNLFLYEQYEKSDMALIDSYKKQGPHKIDEALKDENNESPLMIAVEMSRTIKDK